MSYCGGSCGCGSGCICDSSYGGCKVHPDFDESYNTESYMFGVGPYTSGVGLEGDDDDNGNGAHVKIQAI
ncbi:hypothetical protein MKW92_027604 [Papaver armeniacum]|nr:hypothetical protein MKW92_027604 [Papaver armeniacum]